MKALCYHGARDIRCEEIGDPTPMGPGGAIVRMQACGICGSDLHIYHGQGFVPDTGYCVGHEAVGEVVEVGRGVSNFKAGDQVMISASVALGGCNECANCRAGLTAICLRPAVSCYGISPRLQGCQAEGIAVPMADANLSRIPEGITADQALLMTDNLPTAYMGVKNADVKPGSTVAVVGLGPIGLMAVQIAFVLGAERVFAIDLVPERRARAAELGAVALDSKDAFQVIKDATDGALCQSVIEAVGIDATIDLALALAGRGATVSVFGANQNQAFKYPLWSAFNKQLTFRVAGCIVQDQWAELIPLVRSGRLKPELYITHRMPLTEGAEAYRLFDAREDGALKMVLTP